MQFLLELKLTNTLDFYCYYLSITYEKAALLF